MVFRTVAGSDGASVSAGERSIYLSFFLTGLSIFLSFLPVYLSFYLSYRYIFLSFFLTGLSRSYDLSRPQLSKDVQIHHVLPVSSPKENPGVRVKDRGLGLGLGLWDEGERGVQVWVC